MNPARVDAIHATIVLPTKACVKKNNIPHASSRRPVDPPSGTQITRSSLPPELIKIKASQKNSTGIANYANAITLTPGTVTIEVEKNDLLIHALSKELSEDLQTGEMDRLITGLDK